jgi:hypothetical protein
MAKRRDPAAALTALEGRYADLARSLGQIGFIAQGSLTRRLTHCNKPGCRCGGVPPRLHGPYWQWTAKVAGRTVTRRLSDAEAARYTEWIANDRQLHRTVEQMREVAEQARGIILAAEQGRSSAP